MSYRSNYATIQAGASRDGDEKTRAVLELRGSVASMGGGVFLSNRIDDAFAVVDAGAPGVEVFHENRLVGTTDSNGVLLVPTMRSYQKNKITIDPKNLPIDAEVENSREIVAPADRAGVLVNFKVKKSAASALVRFALPGGGHVPAGASGRTDGGEEFVVGYDGQAFIKNLRDVNNVTIELPSGTCTATFQFALRPGEQVSIGPVICGSGGKSALAEGAQPAGADVTSSISSPGRSLPPTQPAAGAPMSISPDAHNGLTSQHDVQHAPPPAQIPARKASARQPDDVEFFVQVSSQKSEAQAHSSFHGIQSKYPNVLADLPHVVRRADLGSKGIYYRAMVGPFGSRGPAIELCESIKTAGGNCVVQSH